MFKCGERVKIIFGLYILMKTGSVSCQYFIFLFLFGFLGGCFQFFCQG